MSDNTLFFYFGNKKANWTLFNLNHTNVIVTDKPKAIVRLSGDATVVKVKDIYQAYWDFIHFYRGLFRIPVIGVTGTCGKTTTTEMIKTILATRFRITATYDGYNNLYRSLPYLLGIDHHIQAAVFELGVGKPGDLKYMCKHYQPQVGVLLNIGTYHLQGCKTQENYIKAKAELLAGLGFKGTLIMNSDDENIKKIDVRPFQGKITFFGLNNLADFWARDIRYSKNGMEFTLVHHNNSYQVYIPGFGEHTVYNGLAAIAAVYSIGIDIKYAIKCLGNFKPVRQHMEIRKGVNNCTIIDDTWNCTPLSTESAIQVLKKLAGPRTMVAVLGYMPRLGEAGKAEYHRIGKMVAGEGIDYLVIVGNEARLIGKKAIAAGFPNEKISFCISAAQLYDTLLPLTKPDTLVLFKFPYKYRLSKDPSYRRLMNLILR